MIVKRSIQRNTQALSVMYDAVFFIVLVSLSGAILLPALQSKTALQASVEKKREEIVDETLLMLMTSRDEFFLHTFAGSQLQDILGDYSGNWLINTSIQALLGKQLLHKTYADLCTESLISQLNIFHNRLNIFTQQYATLLDKRISNVVTYHIGSKYAFNLSLVWHPIQGVPFGGELFIGQEPPQTNIYVATSYITLPETKLTTWLAQAEQYLMEMIKNNSVLRNIQTYLSNFDTLNQAMVRENLTELINTTFQAVLFDGVNVTIGSHRYAFPGVINTTIDYIFDKIQTSVSNILNKSLGKITSLLNTIENGIDITRSLDSYLKNAILPLLTQLIPGFDGSTITNLDELFSVLKTTVITKTKEVIDGVLTPYITIFVDMIMNVLGSTIDSVAELGGEVLEFFNQRVNILRAEIRLMIWEARS
ncbi:MAG: hypothetical protein QXL17_02460 [Candidatus Thermoplasmatota archaeon]